MNNDINGMDRLLMQHRAKINMLESQHPQHPQHLQQHHNNHPIHNKYNTLFSEN